MRIDLHPKARVELRSAALWYEERVDGLGGEFLSAVDAAFHRIRRNPELFPRWLGTERTPGTIRKAPVERFPYLVAFEQRERLVVVLAVAHQKRRPFYWLERATQVPG